MKYCFPCCCFLFFNLLMGRTFIHLNERKTFVFRSEIICFGASMRRYVVIYASTLVDSCFGRTSLEKDWPGGVRKHTFAECARICRSIIKSNTAFISKWISRRETVSTWSIFVCVCVFLNTTRQVVVRCATAWPRPRLSNRPRANSRNLEGKSSRRWGGICIPEAQEQVD